MGLMVLRTYGFNAGFTVLETVKPWSCSIIMYQQQNASSDLHLAGSKS